MAGRTKYRKIYRRSRQLRKQEQGTTSRLGEGKATPSNFPASLQVYRLALLI